MILQSLDYMSGVFAQKTVGSLSLYRDCLRVVRHMAGDVSVFKKKIIFIYYSNYDR